jgi:hypothetical protein
MRTPSTARKSLLAVPSAAVTVELAEGEPMPGIAHTVFVVASGVCGIDAFHALCPDCPGWRCHRQAHDSQDTAVRCAQRHSGRHG